MSDDLREKPYFFSTVLKAGLFMEADWPAILNGHSGTKTMELGFLLKKWKIPLYSFKGNEVIEHRPEEPCGGRCQPLCYGAYAYPGKGNVDNMKENSVCRRTDDWVPHKAS